MPRNYVRAAEREQEQMLRIIHMQHELRQAEAMQALPLTRVMREELAEEAAILAWLRKRS